MGYDKRILIDCSQLSKNPRGMGLYTLDMVLALQENFNLILIFKNNHYTREIYKNLQLNSRAIYIPLPQVIIEQFIVPLIVLIYRINIYVTVGDSISIFGCRLCSTYLLLHDIYFTKPVIKKSYSIKRRLARLYRRITVSSSIKECEKIITVSNYMKTQIFEYFENIQKEKLYVIPNILRYEQKKIKKNNRDLLLVTGSDPQKNAGWAIETLQILRTELDMIYVVGVQKPEELKLTQYENVKYLGFVQQTELESLYEKCFMLVLPSLEESFGVPLIEALSKNCQICASSAGALPEIGEKFANYFELDNHSSFVTAMRNAFSETHEWSKLSHYLEQFERKNVAQLIRALID